MRFLVGNMAGKGTVGGPRVDEFYAFIDSVYAIRQPEYDIPAIYARFRSGARHLDDPLEPRRDAAMLAADYLIENVDEAMKWWQRPWNAHLSFAEFCEYVLPYRVGSEEVQPWRETYAARFAQLVPDTATALQAATAINDSLKAFMLKLDYDSPLPVSMRPTSLLNMKFGSCVDYAVLAVYAMRSVGIPITLNMIPQWGRTYGSHTFNAILNNDGKWYDFLGAEDDPGIHLHRFANGIPKVYRLGFERNDEALASICGGEKIPEIFRSRSLIDVTKDYDAVNVCDVSIDAPVGCRNHYSYLCVFTPMGWVPVAWGCVDKGKFHFKDIGKEIVYQPAMYSAVGLKTFGKSFYLDLDGHMQFYTPSAERIDMKITRRYPVRDTYYGYPGAVVGSFFEGADNPQFHNSTILHRITTKPDFKFVSVIPSIANPFKFFRYVSSDQQNSYMAEVEFLDSSGTIVHGNVMGDDVSVSQLRNGPNKLYDGIHSNFFHSNHRNAWSGIEVSEPTVVSEIRYLIRNDGGRVSSGTNYELFYLDEGQWISLGRIMANKDDEIMFSNVPAGTLYWLKGDDENADERIFEYSEKKQIIWH